MVGNAGTTDVRPGRSSVAVNDPASKAGMKGQFFHQVGVPGTHGFAFSQQFLKKRAIPLLVPLPEGSGFVPESFPGCFIPRVQFVIVFDVVTHPAVNGPEFIHVGREGLGEFVGQAFQVRQRMPWVQGRYAVGPVKITYPKTGRLRREPERKTE
jgi:hypothetical protein